MLNRVFSVDQGDTHISYSQKECPECGRMMFQTDRPGRPWFGSERIWKCPNPNCNHWEYVKKTGW